MDTVFSLISEEDRASHLRSLMEAIGCNYICLWSYLPEPTRCLYFLDGYYHEENNQASPSSGSLARRLFDEYRREMFFIVNDRVPGMAFINKQPYRELTESEIGRMASVAVQRQFYREARIKTAVFMGCRSGEIEMGWSRVQMNMEDTLRNWFSEDVPQQSPLAEFSQPMDPNRPSSSSSSLKSLSMDSPETSPFLFNIPTTPHISELPQDPTLQPIPTTSTAIQQIILRSLQPIQATTTSPLQYSMQCLQPLQTTATSPLQCSMQSLQPIPSAISPTPHQQVMHAFALVRNTQLPTQESEDAVMARAILAVLTSPSSSTSSSTPNLRQRATAFKKYGSLPTTTTATRLAGLHSQSLLKRAINYYRNLTIVRREHMQASRSTPTSSQMHHMISERRRREKINESFEALRKLLPPEAKKDKASVLTRTREYLTSLKAQVAELSQRNQQLEAQALLPAIEITEEVSESSNERVEVRVALVSESTPEGEERIIDLQVFVRGGSANISNIVIGILEFLKHDRNVNLMSMEATTSATESRLLNRVILRLRIEGNEWEESAFQEAVRRIVADLTH